MTILTGWFQRPTSLHAEEKNPWGSGSGSGGDGPRNPWAPQPGGNGGRRIPGPSALDEFIKRARGGGGGGSDGSGRPRIPGTPNAGTLWIIGVAVIVVM